MINNHAFEPIVIGHDLCDLKERGRDDALHPVDAALCAGLCNLGCRGHWSSHFAIADEVHCGIAAREVFSRGHDGIPRDDAVHVAQLNLTAQPAAFHHCELMALFVAAKELAGFTLADLKGARVAHDAFNIEP